MHTILYHSRKKIYTVFCQLLCKNSEICRMRKNFELPLLFGHEAVLRLQSCKKYYFSDVFYSAFRCLGNQKSIETSQTPSFRCFWCDCAILTHNPVPGGIPGRHSGGHSVPGTPSVTIFPSLRGNACPFPRRAFQHSSRRLCRCRGQGGHRKGRS